MLGLSKKSSWCPIIDYDKIEQPLFSMTSDAGIKVNYFVHNLRFDLFIVHFEIYGG